MAARVVLLGLDAVEVTLIDRWAAEGLLPTLDGLARRAAVFDLDNCMETLPGAIWPEITTGRSSASAGVYFHPRQLRTGCARTRPVGEGRLPAEQHVHHVIASAGRRVAAVDLPQVPLARGLDGVQIVEWGLHDRPFGTDSSPAGLVDRLRSRHGPYPAGQCDSYGEPRADNLRGALVGGAAQKAAIMQALLDEADWDFFAGAFSEGHCAGHQFWHRVEDADANPVRDVYRALDDAVGRVLAAAGDDAIVFLVVSHGMGPYLGGAQLLPEFLARLGLSSGERAGRLARSVRLAQQTVKYLIPRRYWEPAQALLVDAPLSRSLLRPLQARSGALFDPLESPRTRAATLPNNTVGAIRLNLKGREPHGSVAPGNEARALLEDIRTALGELVVPETGAPIVERALTAEEALGADHHPDVPDLLVVFRRQPVTIEACASDRVGLIRVPRGSITGQRTGDHTTRSRLYVRAPAVAPGQRGERFHVTDIAPTLMRLLGVPVPSFVDGRPLPVIAATTA